MKTVRDARLGLVVLVVSLAMAVVGVGMGMAAPAGKVTICHVPPGNPDNAQLITVGAPAVAAHVRLHGDAICATGARDCCADRSGEVCTNEATDVNNCGGCGLVCPTGDVCSEGVCGCATAGDTNCDGICTDLQTDPANCGACGIPCLAPGTCVGGACASTGAG